jgi:iron complex outermembrane receptor protein
VRIPNLAELSSDGLHEGIFTYEIGDPNLKNEQNLALNFNAAYQTKHFELWVSPFYNHFFNYVYLAPTNEDWFGFPIFRYKQQDATQYGAEAGISVKPADKMTIGLVYSGMIAKTKDNNNLPYTPAQKITGSLHYNFKLNEQRSLHCFAQLDYYFAQNNTAPFELATPEYKLVSLGASTTFNINKRICEIAITESNLLNEAYYDHLSRFKNYGLLNIGRNITLSFKMKFQSPIHKSE